MKNKILEVQNYFINKITACEFDSCVLDFQTSGWVWFNTKIDSFSIQFSVHPKESLFCSFNCDFGLKVPNDRLQNLITLIESKEQDARLEKIEKLKSELQQLQTA